MLFEIVNVLKKPYRLIKRLFSTPLPPDQQNFEHNKALWTLYAKTWKKGEVPIQNPEISEAKRDSYIQCLGDEWGRLSDIEEIIADYIYPYISTQSVVAEIGVGGGRIATRVAGKTKELWCFDISREIMKKAREDLRQWSNVKFFLMDKPEFPPQFNRTFDFVYAFDVFVHFDLHMMWKYFREIGRILKDDGRAFLHTANLRAPGGWKRFADQDKYSVIRHYFVSPEIISTLSERARFKIIKKSDIDPDNFYLNRDYLFVMEKS